MATPNVSLSVSQTSRGSKSIKCTYTLSSIEDGASLEFYVKPPSGSYVHMSDYDGSASNGTFNKTLNVNDIWTDYGNYAVKLWVYNNSTDKDSDDDIAVMESAHSNPTVSNFTVEQTDKGNQTINCSWYAEDVESGAKYYLEGRVSGGSWVGLTNMASVSNGAGSRNNISLNSIWEGFGETYQVRIFIYNDPDNWDYYDSDNDSVVMLDNRPNNFIFPFSISSGAATTTLTANKWNNFQDRINEFQAYKSITQTDFDDVSSGDEMTASIMRKAWDAINGISGHGSMPARPSSGSIIYASWFHDLADALNNIE